MSAPEFIHGVNVADERARVAALARTHSMKVYRLPPQRRRLVVEVVWAWVRGWIG